MVGMAVWLCCVCVCSKLRYLALEMFGDLESYMYGSFEFYMTLIVSAQDMT